MSPGGISCFRLVAALAVIFSAALVATPAEAKTHLRISVNAAAMDAFDNWTSVGSWSDIKNFRNGNASRPVVDLILQLQALRVGGLDFDFELERELTYELAKEAVIDGRADLTAETIWDDEIAANGDKLLQTGPILPQGEFVEGFYVRPGQEAALKLTSEEDLRQRSAAVVASWALDVKALQALPLKAILKVATPELAFAAVKRGDADFVLEGFSTQPDLHVQRGGITLVPVAGYKVRIMTSRSWIVSRRSPAADAILKALVAGAKTLATEGTINRAYTECGFLNPQVANWKPLF